MVKIVEKDGIDRSGLAIYPETAGATEYATKDLIMPIGTSINIAGKWQFENDRYMF